MFGAIKRRYFFVRFKKIRKSWKNVQYLKSVHFLLYFFILYFDERLSCLNIVDSEVKKRNCQIKHQPLHHYYFPFSPSHVDNNNFQSCNHEKWLQVKKRQVKFYSPFIFGIKYENLMCKSNSSDYHIDENLI